MEAAANERNRWRRLVHTSLLSLAVLCTAPAAGAAGIEEVISAQSGSSGIALSDDETHVLLQAWPRLENQYLREVDAEALVAQVFVALKEWDEEIAKRAADPEIAKPDPLARDPYARIGAAFNAGLRTLDAHTGYLTPDAHSEMKLRTSGEFGGLGLEVTMEDGLVKVVTPIDDTPAQRAGMQSGDKISHVDDTPVLGMTLRQAVHRMRGRVGTPILLTVLREKVEEPLRVSIVRDIIRIPAARFRIEGNVGYIRVSTFSRQAEKDVRRAIRSFEDELGADFTGLILDLRNNPGGLLDQSIKVADAFLDNGEIVSVRGRYQMENAGYEASFGDLARGKKLVVLINSGSASASEIVAGALKDHRRATVIGRRSFGKGSVQSIFPMGAYGALRLTTQLYYMPSGRTIQAQGVLPDLRVAVVGEDGNTPEVRREENLNNAIDNPSEDESADGNGIPEVTPERCNTVLETAQEDPELACALAFLRLGEINRLTQAMPK